MEHPRCAPWEFCSIRTLSPKGLGIAAPQIGSNRRIAILRPWQQEEICLLNPKIIATSEDTDVRYEGCLSLFDVRGRAQRPLGITIRAQHFSGDFWQATYTQGIARLVCHELDHLDGHLYLAVLFLTPIGIINRSPKLAGTTLVG